MSQSLKNLKLARGGRKEGETGWERKADGEEEEKWEEDSCPILDSNLQPLGLEPRAVGRGKQQKLTKCLGAETKNNKVLVYYILL